MTDKFTWDDGMVYATAKEEPPTPPKFDYDEETAKLIKSLKEQPICQAEEVWSTEAVLRRTSSYQDFVDILLFNDYEVNLTPYENGHVCVRYRKAEGGDVR